MSTVRICRIKLPKQDPTTGKSVPWKGAVHSSSESLYIPDPAEGKTLIINTENEKITGSVEGTGRNSVATVCQERDLLFLTGSPDGEALVYKIGTGKTPMPIRFGFTPERISLDSDRDILLVSNEKYSFYRYPEGKAIEYPAIQGEVRHSSFDSLEDSFIILLGNPARLAIIRSGESLSLSHDISFGDETVNSAIVCSVEKLVVAGTESGKILVSDLNNVQFTVVAAFREPIRKMIYNPLVNHLYVIFRESRNLAIVDLHNRKVREVEKCSSEIYDIIFDELHNKVYALLPSVPALEAYLDMGR